MSTENEFRCLECSDANGGGLVVNNGILGDPSFEWDVPLDYVQVKSHGAYIDGINKSLESLEEYQDGGYHPIQLGDKFGAFGRYRVIHKFGHGSFGTVWLCRGIKDPAY
ncbi:hypothetical protein F4678DRAFT_412014 [Xylaria arbuscula]|nr:hypothetical protein F4678DRAFT_412014 [Xylaria arbuscula]